jgi:hypothetical protein
LSSAGNQSQPQSPAAGGLRRSHTSLSFDDAQPNETTAFLSQRLSSQNYQSFANDGDGTPRARKSVYKRSRSTLRDGPAEEIDETNDHETNGEPVEARTASIWEKATGPFRSIELENKGSVARDHLALGRTLLSGLPKYLRNLTSRRADIPRVAANITGVHLHWHRSHTAFPTQHVTTRYGLADRPHYLTAGWQAIGRRLSGDQYFDTAPGVPALFHRATVDYEWQVPSQSGDGDTARLDNIGDYDPVSSSRHRHSPAERSY